MLLAVGVVTWGLIIWAAVAYRRRKGQTGLPVQLRYNLPIEIFYTIVPLILVLGFFAFTARDQTEIEANNDPEVHDRGLRQALGMGLQLRRRERVLGRHPGAGPRRGTARSTKTSCRCCTCRSASASRSSIESRDVIHSFWIIDFLYKKDMIPAKSNYLYFVPLEEGTFHGKCAELCGEYHSLMLFTVKVVSEAEFENQMQLLRDAGYEGQLGQRVQHQLEPARQRPEHDRQRSPGSEMSTATAPAPSSTQAFGTPSVERKGNVFVKWITTTDHKTIGYLYLISSFIFFMVGGVMALIIRAQLFEPGLKIVRHG